MNDNDGVIKDPDDWKSGGEPETAAQRSYLETLSQEAGEQPPVPLTKAGAAKHIEELQRRTGRGQLLPGGATAGSRRGAEVLGGTRGPRCGSGR